MSNEEKGFNPKYDDNKTSDTIYIQKEKKKDNGTNYRKVELIIQQEENYLSDKNKEEGSTLREFVIGDKVELYSSKGGQQKIHCWLMRTDDKQSIKAIHISRRTGKGVYGDQEVTLNFDAVVSLKVFLDNLFYIGTKSSSAMKIMVSELNRLEKPSFSQVVSEEEFSELIKANMPKTDALYRLLSIQKMEVAVNYLEKIIGGGYKNEVEIQKFLKDNIWMFGNDFGFVVEGNKINASNILDIIPQNFESYIDIIEVKLPKEKPFNYDSSHENFYPTAELTKAIAQTQNYIFELENKTFDKEYQEANRCKIIKPRGIIIFGADPELSEQEKKYLRIMNASYHNLHVLTYQQLLEKARNTIAFQKPHMISEEKVDDIISTDMD